MAMTTTAELFPAEQTAANEQAGASLPRLDAFVKPDATPKERMSRFVRHFTRQMLDKFNGVPEMLTIETFQSTHHFAITSTSRVKMLHTDVNAAAEYWLQGKKGVSESSDEAGIAQANLRFVTEKTDTRVEIPGEQTAHHGSDAEPESAICMVEFEDQTLPIQEDSPQPPVATLRRIGNLSQRVEVDWRLLNGTVNPKLASRLAPASGTAVFEPGEDRAYITGPLIHDPAWNAESFYYIHLQAENAERQNLVLGRNSVMRVFQVNVDRFPGNAPLEATTWELIKGFWQHNYQEMPRETRMGIVLMLITGVNFFVDKRSFKYLVDCGASAHPGETCTGFFMERGLTSLGDGWHEGPLIVLVVFRVFMLFVDHLKERSFRRLRLQGKATRNLRHHLFTVLLQMSNDARLEYDTGDIPEVMDSTSAEAVRFVWIGLFQWVQKFSVLAGSCVLFAQAAWSTKSILAKISIAVAAPVMLLAVRVVVKLTQHSGQKWRNVVVEAEQHWFSLVSMTEQCYDVVVGYREADDMAASINAMHGHINKGWVGFADHNANFKWSLRWCFHAVQAVVLVATGLAARDGKFHLGDFVVVNTTLLNFGSTIVEMAVLTKTILNQAASVQQIANILNSDTRRRVHLRQDTVSGQDSDAATIIDVIGENTIGGDDTQSWRVSSAVASWQTDASDETISLVGVSYSYKSGAESTVMATPKVWFSMEPGQLVCWPRVEGTHEYVGVNTLFKMLAGIIIPETGIVRVPPWWRVIYVPVSPILFDGTLMYNLTYGSSRTDASPDEDKAIVWGICKRLGFSAELIGKDFYDVETSGSRLRNRDRVLVSIVRALLHDVDLLLVSSALDVLGGAQGRQVLEYLHEYVHNYGIESRNPFPEHLRHRKTVIYSTKFEALEHKDVCDALVKLSRRGGSALS